MTERDVNAEYAAGLWVPWNHGNYFTLTRNTPSVPVTVPAWRQPLTDYTCPARTYLAHEDASTLYRTLAESQAECDRRNAGAPSQTAIDAPTTGTSAAELARRECAALLPHSTPEPFELTSTDPEFGQPRLF